jgi:hypothetical protein
MKFLLKKKCCGVKSPGVSGWLIGIEIQCISIPRQSLKIKE